MAAASYQLCRGDQGYVWTALIGDDAEVIYIRAASLPSEDDVRQLHHLDEDTPVLVGSR